MTYNDAETRFLLNPEIVESVTPQLKQLLPVGDENEAVTYVYGNKLAWGATPGTLERLAAKVK
jgi:hypothetical protein